MTAFLLDVNILIALFNPNHVHHGRARDWFSETGAKGWATCPLTEAGLLRIMSNPASGSVYDRPEQVARHLQILKDKFPNHSFWQDSLSFAKNEIMDLSAVLSWKHLTDAYLLSLAYLNRGKLVTLDRGITTNWLRDKKANIIVQL